MTNIFVQPFHSAFVLGYLLLQGYDVTGSAYGYIGIIGGIGVGLSSESSIRY